MNFTPTPEWVDATVRYTLTIVGVLLVTNDVLPQTAWDQIAAALVSIATVTYGVFRTRTVETELQTAQTELVSAKQQAAFFKSHNSSLS